MLFLHPRRLRSCQGVLTEGFVLPCQEVIYNRRAYKPCEATDIMVNSYDKHDRYIIKETEHEYDEDFIFIACVGHMYD